MLLVIQATLKTILRHFLVILLTTYGLAAFFPKVGLAIRDVNLSTITWHDQTRITLSLPLLLLFLLLFLAGISTKRSEFSNLLKSPLSLALGLLTNLLIPILFTVLFSSSSIVWHNFHEVQSILVGLAIIASMPIASSSASWVQNANGNLGLNLGLVLMSTLFSPYTTPLALHSIGFIAAGDYAKALHQLAAHGSSSFLELSVVIPLTLGTLGVWLLGESKLQAISPILKLSTFLITLVLIYSNASLALPQAFQEPDFKFLTAVFIITGSLCLMGFIAGWALSRLLKLPESDRTALLFALGMNNNVTGLILASTVLSQYPLILIPIIFYNLIQQVVAGTIFQKCYAKQA